jgi:hypothetical protein
MSRYIRYPEAREHLRSLGIDLAESTLRRMVSQHRIPFIKIPGSKAVFFSAVALETWITTGCVEPQGRAS